MANKINLRSILCHLVGDENFLSTIIETKAEEIDKKKPKQTGFNLMAGMVTEYTTLAPYDTQNYAHFPAKIKQYVTPEHLRMGIKHIIEKDTGTVNISFLNSLNILLRPELFRVSGDEQARNVGLLESFICHKIQRNYQIDKVKNTRKIQIANKELTKNLTDGKLTHDLLQYVVNIFEINLLVFDLTKMEVKLYWTRGTKYPYFNLFKNIHCMSYTHGNYEPISTPNNIITEEQRRKMYIHILTSISEINCTPKIELSLHTMVYLNTWRIEPKCYAKIVETFFNKYKSMAEEYNRLIDFEKNGF